ncbi:MAG TPA: cytochrome c oxidase subunit II [Thermoleophilaceae bacterium]
MPSKPIVRMFIYGTIASAIGVAIVLILDWFPSADTTDAEKIDRLYDVLMVVSVPIFVLVMAVAIYSVVRFRARPGDTGDGAPIHGNAKLEVVWVLIPFVIVSILAAYAWIVLDDIEEPKPGELRVHVFGQQFTWSYEYRGKDGKPVRSSELVLPVDKPVRFDISSRDVIHSFWIPNFRLKSDAVPGITTKWRATPTKIGRHDIVCAELCGAGHAAMRASAQVVSQGDFDKWLAKAGGGPAPTGGGGGAQSGKPGAADAGGGDGKQVFTANGCGGCHQLADAGASGTTGPSLDNLLADAKKFGGGKTPEEYVRESIENPNAVVVEGFAEGTMPQNYGNTLSDAQIDALVRYLVEQGGGGGN